MSADSVLFSEIAAGHGWRIGRASLNAPATLNAVALGMTDLLSARLAQWAADPGIAMVLLEAEGGKAFCAGGDLQSLYKGMKAHRAVGQAGLPRDVSDFFEREYHLNYVIHSYPKPILCWGHGIVMGGGMGLMVGASHRVATETSRLAMPEILIGLFPDVAMSWKMNRMPGKSGVFLGLTGASLHAADALLVDWADYYIEHAHRAEVLESLRALPWRGNGQHDGVLLDRALKRHADALPEAGPLRRNFDAINQVCQGRDFAETVRAILAWQPQDPWLQGARDNLAKGAPSTARLAWELRRRANHMSLAEVLGMEYRAAMWCCTQGDFQEGIRALLIDKDKTPAWPQRHGDTDGAWAERVFGEMAAIPLPPLLAGL